MSDPNCQVELINKELKLVQMQLTSLDQSLKTFNEKLATYQPTRRERWWRSLAPAVLILGIWVAGVWLLTGTQTIWGTIDKKEWETVVLRSVVLVSAFASLTAVSIAAMRRDW